MRRTILVDLVLRVHASSGSLVSEQSDLVSQDLGIATLYEHRREAGKVAEEGGGVRVGEVFGDLIGTEVAFDRVEVIVIGRSREVVVLLRGHICRSR